MGRRVFRTKVPGPHFDAGLAGSVLHSTADVVTSAPELARLTLNIAATHHDSRVGGRRLVYGGHTIGLALAQAGRLLPNLVTVLGWESCDHTGPVHEGDTLYSELHIESAEPAEHGECSGCGRWCMRSARPRVSRTGRCWTGGFARCSSNDDARHEHNGRRELGGHQLGKQRSGLPDRPARRAGRLLPRPRAVRRARGGRGPRRQLGHRRRRGRAADRAGRPAGTDPRRPDVARRRHPLARGADGWCALTLSRADDLAAVPALLQVDEAPADPWRQLQRWAAARTVPEIVERSALLDIPVAGLGEMAAASPRTRRVGPPAPPRGPRGLLVADLSSMWAGPLCGQLLARAGATVVKVESPRRPDGTRAGDQSFSTG